MGRIFEKRKESIFKTAAQKSKLYAKYGKKLYMAAKNGVPDPEANPALRSVVEKAKRENVPSHVIEKAIQKARGAGGEDFHLVRYEGFGPGGALVIVDCLTDNNQRTISEIRNCFTKTGSKLAANGSVAMSFDHLAVLSFKGDNEEQVLEAMFARGRRRRRCRKQRRLHYDLRPACRVLQSQDGPSRCLPGRRAGNPGDHLSSAGQPRR